MKANQDLEGLTHGFVEAFRVDIEVQRACVELYRQLAAGKPVPLENVASVLAVSAGQLKRSFGEWVISALEYDEQGHVVAFGGLTLKPTPYRFEVAEKMLYTWCALDCLFIPRLIDKSAKVESTCPVSKRLIRLLIEPDRIGHCNPDGAHISIVALGSCESKVNVRDGFCCHVHFFGSQDTAHTWLLEHKDAIILPVNEAFKLAKIIADQLLKLPEEI